MATLCAEQMCIKCSAFHTTQIVCQQEFKHSFFVCVFVFVCVSPVGIFKIAMSYYACTLHCEVMAGRVRLLPSGKSLKASYRMAFIRRVSCITSAMVTGLSKLMILTRRKPRKENRICMAPSLLLQEFQEVIILYETVCALLDCL